MSFQKGSVTIDEGETVNLKKQLVIEPESADTITITWSSSNENVAFVSKSGRVTGGLEGKAVITASSHGKTATCDISVVSVPIESYKLATTVSDVYLGDEVELSISDVKPANAGLSKLSWKSSNADCQPYFDVESSKWYVRASAYETVTLTSSYDGLADQTCKIPVNVNTIKSITVSPSNPAMLFESSLELTAEITKQNSSVALSYPENLEWSSSDKTIATVDGNGVVTSKSKEGECIIYCKHKSAGKGDKETQASVSVYVTQDDPITEFALNIYTLDITAGESGTVEVASFSPSTSSVSQIRWKSNDDEMVSLNFNNGKCTITAKNIAGECYVTASANGYERKVRVTVNPVKIKSVSIDTDAGIIFAKSTSTYTFKYTISPANATIKYFHVYFSDLEEEDYSAVLNQEKKEIVVNVKSSVGEKFSKSAQLCVTVSDGVNVKYANVSPYIITADIFEKVEYNTNIYGTFGMSSTLKPTFLTDLPTKLKSKVSVRDISMTHSVSAAIQVDGGGSLKDEYTYEEDGVTFRYLVGKVGSEYCTTVKYRISIVDMNGSRMICSPKCRQYRNFLVKYEYSTKENGNNVRGDINIGGTIEVNAQKNSSGKKYYEAMKIVASYNSLYMERETPKVEENAIKLYSIVYSDKYDSYKGTTKTYYLGQDSWKIPKLMFYAHFNK